MAGTLTVDTLKTSTGVLATQNGMTGIAKAWVNFSAASGVVSIRSSFNISSVTRTATGRFTVAFTTAMPNNYYTVTGGARRYIVSPGEANVNVAVQVLGLGAYDTVMTTSAFQIVTGIPSSEGSYDFDYNAITVFSA